MNITTDTIACHVYYLFPPKIKTCPWTHTAIGLCYMGIIRSGWVRMVWKLDSHMHTSVVLSSQSGGPTKQRWVSWYWGYKGNQPEVMLLILVLNLKWLSKVWSLKKAPNSTSLHLLRSQVTTLILSSMFYIMALITVHYDCLPPALRCYLPESGLLGQETALNLVLAVPSTVPDTCECWMKG